MQVRHGHLADGRHATDLSAEQIDNVESEGKRDHREKSHDPVHVEQHADQTQDGERIAQDPRGRRRRHGLDQPHVVLHSRDQPAGLFLVEKGEGKIQDAAEEHVSKVHQDASSHTEHEILLSEIGESTYEIDRQKQERDHPDHGPILGQKYVVQHRLHQIGGGRCRRRHDRHADHGETQRRPALENQREHRLVAVLQDRMLSKPWKPSFF